MMYLFNIHQAKDEEFGIEDYRDRVCVIVESGDPGGEPGEFEAFMGESLSEWCGFDPDITAQQVETIVGFNPASQARYCYEVVAPGEPGAGIRGFTDSVTVLLESGNPGGDPGDFKGHLRAALNQWYDGAKVTQVDSKQPTQAGQDIDNG